MREKKSKRSKSRAWFHFKVHTISIKKTWILIFQLDITSEKKLSQRNERMLKIKVYKCWLDMCSIVRCATIIICLNVLIVQSKNSKLLFSEQEIGKCSVAFTSLYLNFVQCTERYECIMPSSDTARATVCNQLFMASSSYSNNKWLFSLIFHAHHDSMNANINFV